MGDKTVSVRVRFEGGDQVKAGLQEVGREGTRALQSIGTVSAATGAELQNAGYQVSDFFVQVAGGTAPSLALAQQMPQLLQDFGLVGVAASVLIAALPGLWQVLGNGRGSAEELEASVRSLGEAMRAYRDAASAGSVGPGQLFEDFGGNAAQAKELLEIQRQIAAARAQNALGQASGSIADFLGGDAERIEAYRLQLRELRAEVESARNNPPLAVDFDFAGADADIQKLQGRLDKMNSEVVDNLSSSLNVSTEGAARIVEALGAVAEASDAAPRDQASAMAALRGSILDSVSAGGQLNEEAFRLLQTLTDAELAALSLSMVDMASPIGLAAGEAARLADNLAEASRQSLAAMAIEFSPGGRALSAYGGRTPGGTAEQLALEVRNTPKARTGGGGGGGADQDIARSVALTESLRSETEKYAIALEEINRLKAKGLITDETYTRQLDKLNEKLGTTGDLGKKAAAAIRGAFDGLFDDPAAALKDLAKQLAMMAIYAQLGKSFPSIFGGGGLIPLGVPGFAAGGRHRGGLRIVGENGPELEATGPSMIYPADALRSMGRGGGSSPAIININNNSTAAISAQEKRGPNGQQVIDVMVASSIGSGKQDGPLRSRFGSRPAPVKR